MRDSAHNLLRLSLTCGGSGPTMIAVRSLRPFILWRLAPYETPSPAGHGHGALRLVLVPSVGTDPRLARVPDRRPPTRRRARPPRLSSATPACGTSRPVKSCRRADGRSAAIAPTGTARKRSPTSRTSAAPLATASTDRVEIFGNVDAAAPHRCRPPARPRRRHADGRPVRLPGSGRPASATSASAPSSTSLAP